MYATTSTALTSIATGLTPGEHGLVGYRIDVAGEVMNVLRWHTSAGDARRTIEPRRMQPFAPFLGESVPVVSRAELEGTAFTEAHMRGSKPRGWRSVSSIPVVVNELLRSGERFVYAYYDGIDKIAHERGFGAYYDAELVAANTYDAAEYLMRLHKAEGTELNMEFSGEIPEKITYHAPCHLRAQNIGLKSRDLLKLTGAKIKLVQTCSGIDGMWGLRAENADLSMPIAKKLADEINAAEGDEVAGDCHLANTAINEQTGKAPSHPLQLLARAYGIPEEK